MTPVITLEGTAPREEAEASLAFEDSPSAVAVHLLRVENPESQAFSMHVDVLSEDGDAAPVRLGSFSVLPADRAAVYLLGVGPLLERARREPPAATRLAFTLEAIHGELSPALLVRLQVFWR